MLVRSTVVIATCDRPDRLVSALSAVLRAIRASGEAYEIVVVDNGPGGLAESAARDVVAPSTVPVKVVRSRPRDKSAALNRGIAEATGEWLVFTDDDCLPAEAWLQRAAVYRMSSGVDIFGGRVIAGKPDFPLPRWLMPGRSGRVPGGTTFVRYAPLRESGVLGARLTVPFGANVFVRDRIFRRYGGYDEALWQRCGAAALGSEDAEFGMRVRAAGERIGYCAEAVVVHPAYKERATLRNQVRHAYHSGIREAILFPADPNRPSVPYLVKDMVTAAGRAVGHLAIADSAAAVHEMMNALKSLGELRGRRM